MKGKKIVALLLAMTMGASLAACGGGGDSKGGDSAKGEEGGKDAEQYINTYLASEPTTLDVSRRSDSYSSDILMNCLEGLIRIEQREGEYKIMPGDAESWETSEDGTVWTFHLGEDRKWDDGEPVTADQYVYSLQRSADPATGCPNAYFLTPIKNYDQVSTGASPVEELGVKAVDEHTLEITLNAAMPSFLESCDASIYYPQRKDKVEAAGDQYGAEADTLAYNGPFKLESWTHNSEMKIVKNEEYWDAENVDLDYVNYQIITDAAAVANAFDAGQLDVMSASSSEMVEKYKADPSLKYTKISGGNITFAFFNTTDKLFSNKNVRKAFVLAADQEDLNDMAYSNLREPLYGWIAPALSVDGKSMREEAGDSLKEQRNEMEAEGKTPKDILIEGMEELGLGNDPKKLDVTFSLGGTDEWFHTFGEYLQQMYKEQLGIDLKIEFADWSIFESNLQSGNYQIGMMGWGAYYNDPYDMLSIHLSNANQIYTGWSNEEYDKLTKAGVIELDPEKRMQDYIAAEKILLDEYVTDPFATTVVHQFTRDFMHDKYAEYGQENLYFTHPGWKNVYTSGR